MSRFSRIIVLVVGLMSVIAAMAGAANANTWSNVGDTNFTATTGPGALRGGGARLDCSGGTATGLAPATEAGPNYTLTGNITFRPCMAAPLSPQITCVYTLTGVPPVTSGLTRGTVAVSCAVSIIGCIITGTIPADYTNATTTANGFFRVRGTTGLTVQPGCILSGSGTLTPDPMTFTVSAATGGNHPTFRLGPILGQP